MVADALLDFFLRHKLVVLFYLGVVLFIFFNRKKFEFHLKFMALYRTSWGIKLMDRIAAKHRELVRLFGYISIGLGFAGMVYMLFILLQAVYVMFTLPDAPAAVAPLLPGVRVPGVPDTLFIPLVQGVLAILFAAVVHEFFHGLVSRAHNIPVKATGLVMLGPIFGAFVEPDDKVMKKKGDVVNYSVIAAGPVANLLTFFLVTMLLSYAVYPAVNMAYGGRVGISFSSVSPGSPAAEAGLETGVVYDIVNGGSLKSYGDLYAALNDAKPGDRITVGNSDAVRVVVLGSAPGDDSKPYMGVNLYDRVSGDTTVAYRAIKWLIGNPIYGFPVPLPLSQAGLLPLFAFISLAIGFFNLLPLGPIDGGKMFQTAMQRVRGEDRGNKALAKLSFFLLFVVILLLAPVLKAIGVAIIGWITSI